MRPSALLAAVSLLAVACGSPSAEEAAPTIVPPLVTAPATTAPPATAPATTTTSPSARPRATVPKTTAATGPTSWELSDQGRWRRGNLVIYMCDPGGDAIAVERLRDRPADEIREVQATVGAAVDGIWGPETEGKVRRAAERICPRPDPEPAATATTRRAPRPIRSVVQDVVSLAYSADRGYDADIDARFQTLAEEASGPLTGAIRRVADAGGNQLMRRCAANQMVFDYNLYLDGRGGNLNEWLATPYLDLDTDIRRRADGALGSPCDDFPWYE